jgi:ABC-type transporter Mla subunit MlaD
MDNRPDLRQLVRGLHSDITAAGRLLDQANRVVGDARQPLQRFTEASLTDLAALIIDARNSVNQISHVLGELDRHPARYLLGNKAGQGLPLK